MRWTFSKVQLLHARVRDDVRSPNGLGERIGALGLQGEASRREVPRHRGRYRVRGRPSLGVSDRLPRSGTFGLDMPNRFPILENDRTPLLPRTRQNRGNSIVAPFLQLNLSAHWFTHHMTNNSALAVGNRGLEFARRQMDCLTVEK